jgi:hypothetical protein
VIAGFHDFSSFKIDKHTVPDGNTFGWKIGGVNLPLMQNMNIRQCEISRFLSLSLFPKGRSCQSHVKNQV